MASLRHFAVAALLCLSLTAGAVTVRLSLSENPDGTRDTAFPSGNKPIGGSSCSTFTCDDIGDASADINEDSASQVTIATSGTSDSTGDMGIAYKTIAANNDIQVKARIEDIGDWIGPVENYTQFGVGIRESIAQDSYFAHCFWPGISNARFKRGVAGGSIADSIGESGSSQVYARLAYDVSETELVCSHSFDDETYSQTGPTEDKELTCDPNCLAYVYGISHSGDVVTSTIDSISIGTTLDDPPEEPETPGPRQVNFSAGFESGQIQDKDGLVDAFFIHTLPINQSGSTSISSGNGGFGPSSQTDTRVIQSRTPPSNGNGSASETVLPRKGSYFLETTLHYDKDYTELNNGLEKPRQKMNVTGADGKFEFDTEVYIGFSVFIPSNYEIETTGRRHTYFVLNTTASGTLVSLETFGDGGQRWKLHYYTGLSVSEGSSSENYVDLGPILDDAGMWTDFVIRYRANPFTSTTNASTLGGKNQTYEGNKGILQVWKTTGDVDGNGNRAFTRFINIVNAPVGLVPHATLPIQMRLDTYKGNWQQASTSVDGPIWHAFDEFYQGEVVRDGTGFSDVNPSRLSAP